MATLLYSIYAVVVLVVAVGGLLGVVFGTPDATDGDDAGYRYQALAVVAALFIVAMIGGFLL